MLVSLRKTRVDMSIMLVIVRTNGAAYWAFKQVDFHLIMFEVLLNCCLVEAFLLTLPSVSFVLMYCSVLYFSYIYLTNSLLKLDDSNRQCTSFH